MKYLILTPASFGLFKVCAAVAYAERGYEAVGGEVFVLLLPLVWYIVERWRKKEKSHDEFE